MSKEMSKYAAYAALNEKVIATLDQLDAKEVEIAELKSKIRVLELNIADLHECVKECFK